MQIRCHSIRNLSLLTITIFYYYLFITNKLTVLASCPKNIASKSLNEPSFCQICYAKLDPLINLIKSGNQSQEELALNGFVDICFSEFHYSKSICNAYINEYKVNFRSFL